MDNSDLKKRRPYPTAAQKARLVSHLESDPDLSNGKYSTSFSKNEAERRWSDIADELNTIPGVVKTWIEWRKTWQDMKCSSKRKNNPKQKPPDVTDNPTSMYEESITSQDDSSTSHEYRQDMIAECPELPSGPKLMIELEGNGNTVSVTCTKKEIVPDISPCRTSTMSCRSTFLNNRRYTYDYFCQDNICRLCWSTTNSTRSVENEPSTAQKILEYVGVDVNAGTPKTVCSFCLIKIESFVKFRRLCQEADRKLKIILSNDISHCKSARNVKLEKNYDDHVLKKEAHSLSKKLTAKVKYIKQEKALSDFDDDTNDVTEDNYCSACNVNFDSTELMIKHNVEAHKDVAFECYGCNKMFNHKLKLCKDTMEYSCSGCCKCVPARRLASRLKVKKCEKAKVFKCQICSEIFKVHLDMRRHVAMHKKEMKFVCETCGRVLKNKKSLSEHMLIHTSNKQLKCPHCDYRATLKTSLVYHIRLHTGERPYACDRCPYTCVTSSNLRRHINTTHLGIRAFKCQICSKEYMYKRSLKEHITSAHQGKKENMCKRCGALYFRFEHLRKHILVKHRKVIKKVKDDYFEVNDAGYKKMSRYKIVHGTHSGV